MHTDNPVPDQPQPDEVRQHVASLWRRALQRDVAPDTRFTDLGGDSLLLLGIITDLEDAYGVDLDVDTLVEDLTVAGMTRVVVEALGR